MTPKESAIVLAKALDSKKGGEIKVLRTEELTTLADYFVICTAGSSTQIKALSKPVRRLWRSMGSVPIMWRGTGAAPGC